jgi:parallel beta helix pectate lyase-like protein
MRIRIRPSVPMAMAVGCLFLLTANALGADVRVNCGGKTPPTTITGALKLVNPNLPNKLTISGTCNENVVIQGFNRLTLIGGPGATINDTSGGVGIVINIEDSTDVTLRGLIVNGGAVGVLCGDFSVCRFEQDVIQGAVGVGVQAFQSRAGFRSTTLQNNGIGLVSLESSSVRSFGDLIVRLNLGSGVDLDTGGSFASFGDTIRDHGGNGVEVNNHGSVLLVGTTVTGNSLNGVVVVGQSAADIEADNVITGNGHSGVFVRDVSFAEFRGASTVTGNGSGLDVACLPQFPSTRGALTNIRGGNTNCVEP